MTDIAANQRLAGVSAAPTTADVDALALAGRGAAIAMMVLSSVMLSSGGLIVRSLDQADAWQTNLYRAIGICVAVAAILFIRYGADAWARLRAVGLAGLFGGVILAVAGVAHIQALTTTTVANTMFILSAIPFLTALLARLFLGERLRRTTLATMIFAAAGVGVMVIDGLEAGSLFGSAMALLTATAFSTFAVIVRRNRHVDMLPTLMISGLAIACAGLFQRHDDLAIPQGDLVTCVLWGALVTALANWMFIRASRALVAAELTLFMLLEFALAPLWVWLAIAETPSRLTLIGGALVIAAVLARSVVDLRRPQPRLKRGRLSPPS